ncbi:hypothetical protein [Algicola sagamiensis]|uniref:hypothetical protein n=1 Tax=Algicola sagamiensis TaxID=163869 RepID=UPI0003699DC7|nr:hypothetical protein [Algicola sagamiensis]
MSINVRFQIVLLFAVTLAVLLISSIHQRHIQSVEDGYLKETLNRELLFLRESILMETHVQSLSKYFSNVSGDIDKLQQLFQSKSNLYPDTHFVILNEKGEILLDLSNRDHAILKNLLKPLNEQFVTRLLVNRTLKITSIQQNHYAFSLLPLSPSDRFLAKPFRPVMDHRYVLMAYRQYTPSYLWHLSWQKSDIAFFVCTLLLLLVFLDFM